MAADLPIWVIYDHPRDFPDKFVARLWLGEKPTEEVMISGNIRALRMQLQREGFVRLERRYEDDAKIVETWL